MKLKVGLTYDLKEKISPQTSPVPFGDVPTDELAEYDSQETIDAIAGALRKRGCNVEKISARGACPPDGRRGPASGWGAAHELLKRLSSPRMFQPRLGVDIVFNIAEGYGGRNREAYAPCLLELFDIPYVGSDSLTLSLSLDKAATKNILRFHGIPTPPDSGGFPKIVKPRYEGSAKGIWPDSIVYNETELTSAIERTKRHYNQDAVVEQFITGSECTVPILGNGRRARPVPERYRARALAVIPRLVEKETTLGCHVAQKVTAEALKKVEEAQKGRSKVTAEALKKAEEAQKGNECAPLQIREFVTGHVEFREPEEIDDGLEEKIKNLALETFFALECRDFARVDFRISKDGVPCVLEINPLPSLAKDDSFALVAEYLGWGYDEMIWRILECALQRYGKR